MGIRFLLSALLLLLPATANAGEPVLAKKHMVAAAHPLAAEAGLEILRAGGTAMDAAVAVQMVLGLVEPQSSGIGGGAFLLYFDKTSGKLTAWDGRETAPKATKPDLFIRDGRPMPFWDAVVGGRSVGVPGVPRMLEAAHNRHGKLAWKPLFDPAIKLATEGFAVTPRLELMLKREQYLRDTPAAAALYYPGGTPVARGSTFKNPAYAATLQILAAKGSAPFYTGGIAREIVATVQAAGGALTGEDMAAYRAIPREALCRPYRKWNVCGMPPPTSGGIAVLQILGILENFDLTGKDPASVEVAHLLAEAGSLAFADRGLYVADADKVPVPVEGLLDRGYLKSRAMLIDPEKSRGRAEPGEPPIKKGALPASRNWRTGLGLERPSTSHFSIVDKWGNAVSMTSSIENAFGSRLMAGGFLLNNQLTDFSFRPRSYGKPVANAPGPGKRPRSSMSPTLVFDQDGKLVLAVGSPGGPLIIGFVAHTIIATLDGGVNIQRAIELPRVVPTNGRVHVEALAEGYALSPRLKARGHNVAFRRITSGLHAIRIREDGILAGGADPRREGIAQGD